ncbi:MAG: hypothetical protein FRX48_01231 [Lasallia pustulata]|uniref:Peptidase M20 dimerisation domain-containing protein n=1 Tax=Lasallia pustulata TaxID=136370 RepID=A0A5M8PZE8_9LECA|nr:MAG: hypothetical protein FRX48_01231 [Lasallia pustulata]
MLALPPLATKRGVFLLSKIRVRLQSQHQSVIGPRRFSVASSRRYASLRIPDEQIDSLRVDGRRLVGDIHATAAWGTGERWGDDPTQTGLSRPALSPPTAPPAPGSSTPRAPSAAPSASTPWATSSRCGRGGGPAPPPSWGRISTRSPRAGGTMACWGGGGGEMLRVLVEGGVETEFAVGVVDWTNEEGARFPMSMVASGVWAGEIPIEKAHALKEVGAGGRTMREELESIGYLGEMEASYKAMPIAAHFELHIEQGPLLESNKQRIGIVHGVQAYRWHTLTVHGRDAHTGTTDFAHRADALLTTAKLLLHSHRLATAASALASTGILSLSPGSTNTVPGRVRFSLDIRAREDETLEALEAGLRRDFERIAGGRMSAGWGGGTRGRPCGVRWGLDFRSRAVGFHADCIQCVEESARGVVRREEVRREMVSGAGHDSVFTSKRCPTSMIFVPCRDGVSHHPAEYCSPEDCATGAQVLLGAVLRYDRLRAERAERAGI